MLIERLIIRGLMMRDPFYSLIKDLDSFYLSLISSGDDEAEIDRSSEEYQNFIKLSLQSFKPCLMGSIKDDTDD